MSADNKVRIEQLGDIKIIIYLIKGKFFYKTPKVEAEKKPYRANVGPLAAFRGRNGAVWQIKPPYTFSWRPY